MDISKNQLVIEGHIPFDKSWIIRMGVLDLTKGYDTILRFLEKHDKDLSSDLKSLYDTCLAWRGGRTVDVGESGTLYRFLQFANWKLDLKKEFTFHGTLEARAKEICNRPEIIYLPLEKLLELDNHTSQWASAAVLMGSKEKLEDIKNPPYKLKLTYEALEHWKEKRSRGLEWDYRYDETILRQAETFLKILGNKETSKPDFEPRHSEDYCFARAFNYITRKQGEELWPSLKSHESNRLEEMEREIEKFESAKGGAGLAGVECKINEISSQDHRVVQAIAMLQFYYFFSTKAAYRDCVSKSWPQFWKFLAAAENLKHLV